MATNQNLRGYNYRDQEAIPNQDWDVNITNKCFWRVTRFIFTVVLLVLVGGASLGGATLTHYVLDGMEIGSLNEWQLELVKVLLVGVPLGIMVGAVSFDFKAGLVVSLLTASSLFIATDTYIPKLGHFENGAFDFLLGQKLFSDITNTSYNLRDLAGISLWGMVLTFPTGYILYSLDFGPTYSLSGCAIGLIYFFSQNASVSLGALSCKGDKCAYYIWGFWIWYVLLLISIIRLCKSIKFVVPKDKQPIFLRCYQWICYNKIYSAIYELNAFLFTFLLLASLGYYALVNDNRLRKGMTFFGLLVNTLGLVITQSYRTGKCVQAWLHKRTKASTCERRRIVRQPSNLRCENDSIPPTYTQVLAAEPLLYPQLTEAANNNNNNIPSPPAVTQQNNAPIAEDEFPNDRATLLQQQQQPDKKSLCHGCYRCIYFFQKFFYIEILRILQLVFDLTGILFLVAVVVGTVSAIVAGSSRSRYVD